MFNIGGPEVLVIFLVALLVLGPSKLPDAARQMGKAMAEFRRMSTGFKSELRDALNEPIDTTPSAPSVPQQTSAPAVDPLTTADDEPTA
jgi:Tat protein translocase TatB subunit